MYPSSFQDESFSGEFCMDKHFGKLFEQHYIVLKSFIGSVQLHKDRSVLNDNGPHSETKLAVRLEQIRRYKCRKVLHFVKWYP